MKLSFIRLYSYLWSLPAQVRPDMIAAMGHIFAGLALGLSASASASLFQPSPVPPGGSYLRAEDSRVAEVSYRIGSRGVRHCPRPHPLTGLLLHHLAEYAPKDRAEAAAEFGLAAGPGIVAVVPDSPAARSGLSAGDVLLSVNGIPFESAAAIAAERHAKTRRKLIERSEAHLEEQLRLGSVRLEVLRDGKRMVVPLQPVMGCEARGRLARSPQANAFADGRYAIMTTKMLDFVRNDDELAVVMAHEIAHNLLGHPAQLESQKVPHGILRSFGKNASRVRATEEEADRLSLKLLWSAGYDLSAIMPFWRRLYSAYDPIPLPKLLRTHPSLGARERIVREVASELGVSIPTAR